MTRAKEIEIDHYFLSVKKYAAETGIGYAEALKWCKDGTLPAHETDGGQWKVKVYKNSAVSREEHERVLVENAALKAKLDAVRLMLTG